MTSQSRSSVFRNRWHLQGYFSYDDFILRYQAIRKQVKTEFGTIESWSEIPSYNVQKAREKQ